MLIKGENDWIEVDDKFYDPPRLYVKASNYYCYECCKNCSNNPLNNPFASGICNCSLPSSTVITCAYPIEDKCTTYFKDGIYCVEFT